MSFLRSRSDQTGEMRDCVSSAGTAPVSSNAAADASHERGVLTGGLAGYGRKCWSWIGIVHRAQALSLRASERCPALGQMVKGCSTHDALKPQHARHVG